jgi:hypothetical protein
MKHTFLEASMQTQVLNCPSCGAPLPAGIEPSQPFHCEACHSTLVLTDLDTADHVRCRKCDTRNPGNSRFCQRCGGILEVECPFCYQANEVLAAHCRQCGVNLTKAWHEKAAWLARQRQHEQERWAALEQTKQQQLQTDINRLVEDLDEPHNHSMAIYCLHQIGSPAVEHLIAALKDEDPDARHGSAKALGLIRDQRAVPALIEALADPEPAVRYWAVDALGKLQAEHASAAIGALVHDRHEGVRLRAKAVMEQFGAQQALQAAKQKKRWWPF